MTKNSSVVVSIVIFSSVPLLVRELQTQDTCKIREVGTFLVKKQMWNVPLSIFCLKISKFATSNPITHLPPTIFLPSVPESSVHVYVALSSGVPCTHEDADYRSSDFFRPSISYHHALSCRCRLSLLCVGHLRILPGAPPRDAGMGAGVSQPRALSLRSRLLHPLATEFTDTRSTRQAF